MVTTPSSCGSARWSSLIRRCCTEPDTVAAYLQPIVDLDRGVVAGYESLARFVLAPASPPQWFAAAAELGLDGALEARAISAGLARRSELPPNRFLSLNVSPGGLLQPEVRAAFARAGDLRGVVVELTEQTAVEDYAAVLAVFGNLRAAGAHIAVDDAGAGYASLRHVTALRPDFVKVDANLISGVDRDPAKAAVIEMLGGLTSRLDAWLIAEGVETAGELEFLAGLGVPLAQGFGLGRPAVRMQEAPGSVRQLHARRRFQRRKGQLATLATSAATVRRPHDVDQGERPAVLLDEFGRPELLLTDGGPREIMRASAHARLAAVAERAMSRPVERRYDPVACCDEQGRLLGVVTVERLVAALARSAASSEPGS